MKARFRALWCSLVPLCIAATPKAQVQSSGPFDRAVLQVRPSLRKIALTGEPAPGTPAGTTFRGFSGPRLDASRRVAFYAFLDGPGVEPTNDQGIWSRQSGSLELVARTGAPAPGTLGAVFSNLFLGANNPPALGVDAAGTIRFLARVTGGDVCDCNGNGVLDNDTGWWSDEGGELALVARANGQVPGLPPGVLFDTLVGAPIVAADGKVAQLFVIKGAGVGFANGQGIMSDAGGELSMIARAGDPAPGLPAGVTFGFFGRPFIGPTGSTSFFASLAGAGVTEINDDSLWAERQGDLTMLVRQGDPAPGGGAFGLPSVQGVFTNMSLRGGDELAFACLLSDGGSGLFSDASGSLAAVARSGMQAPGLPAGTQFGGFGAFVQDGPLQLSDAGHIAFIARLNTVNPSNESIWLVSPHGDLQLFSGFLAGPGFPNFGQRGLYATDEAGTLHKIVQPTDVVDVSGTGDLRTVADVFFNEDGSGLEHYNGPTFSGKAVVFRLAFTDGSSGVFIAALR